MNSTDPSTMNANSDYVVTAVVNLRQLYVMGKGRTFTPSLDVARKMPYLLANQYANQLTVAAGNEGKIRTRVLKAAKIEGDYSGDIAFVLEPVAA